MIPDWLLPLEAAMDPAKVGTKALHLGQLLRAGFPVPPAFVLSADAEELEADHQRQLLGKACADLGPVAVRSSATLEDLPGRSYAGMYESVLNVTGETALWEAVQRVRASRSSQRVQAYGEAGSMAVLIQRMVPAECAGVLFTAHPLTGKREECLIEAVPGLGEGLVSGQRNPDSFRCGSDGELLERRIVGERPLLDGAQIAELIQLGKAIEALFQCPQDVEWALAEGRIWILQARPVTALPSPKLDALEIQWGHPANAEALKDRVIFWSSWNTRENMPWALKPLAWSVFSDVFMPGAHEALWGITPSSPLFPASCSVDLVNGRVYWNMNLLYGHPFLGPTLRKGLHLLDREAGERLGALLANGELRPLSSKLSPLEYLRASFKAARVILRYPWWDAPEDLLAQCEAYASQIRAYQKAPLDGLSANELLLWVGQIGRLTSLTLFPILLAASKALVGISLIRWLLKPWPEFRAEDLLGGLPGNRTTETALDLFRLSRVEEDVRDTILGFEDPRPALSESESGRAFLSRFQDFLDRYGHRGTRDLDLGQPGWREDPAYLFQVLRGYFQKEGLDPLEQFEAAARRREALTHKIEDRLGAGLRRWLFRRALSLVHRYLPWRENEKFYGCMMFPCLRRILQEIGTRWVRKGWIQVPEEIFWFSLKEIQQEDLGVDPRARIQERRSRWENQQRESVRFILRSDGLSLEDATPLDEGVLRGVAASSGCVRAQARIIRDPSESHRFIRGEILVAPTTEPGWVPLFLLARGLVMEVGGVICHGAIAARECGLPAVVGVVGATRRIQDGDWITVDGDRGEVRLEERASEKE